MKRFLKITAFTLFSSLFSLVFKCSTFLLVLVFCVLSASCSAKKVYASEISSTESPAGFAQDSFTGENTSLYLGNPSGAKSEKAEKTNYLIEKKQYALSYNSEKHIPNWVAWHLCKEDIGQVKRSPIFVEETRLPFGWYRVQRGDFQFSVYGFERGHLCPSGDRTNSTQNNTTTFSMANVVPQAPKNNSTVWNDLEQYCRRLALKGNELYIIAGSHGVGGTSKNGTFEKILVQSRLTSIAVPAYLWKVVISIPEGNNDIERITEKAKVIAILSPNTNDCLPSWKNYSVSIDYLEEITGYDFFDLLPDEIENLLEARVAK